MGSLCCKSRELHPVCVKKINTEEIVDILILCSHPIDMYCNAVSPDNASSAHVMFRHHIHSIATDKLMETINRYVLSRLDIDRYIRMEIEACDYMSVQEIEECVYRFSNASYKVNTVHSDRIVFFEMVKRFAYSIKK